jgi:hypothetical protein
LRPEDLLEGPNIFYPHLSVGFGHFSPERNKGDNQSRLINRPSLSVMGCAVRRPKEMSRPREYGLPNVHAMPLNKPGRKNNDSCVTGFV